MNAILLPGLVLLIAAVTILLLLIVIGVLFVQLRKRR